MSLAPAAPSLALLTNGYPQFRLVLPPRASAAEEYAAEELRRHLLALAGLGPQRRNDDRATVRVVINDWDAAAAAGLATATLKLGPEAFHLATSGAALFILGGGPRGVLYGVYHLLELLGVRWFTPEITHYARRREVVVPPLALTQAPAFEFRDTLNWSCSDPAFWVRRRLNGWACKVPEYMGGHVDYGGFVHTFYALLPPDEFFASHPEYYALVKGVRMRDGGQLCLTHPDVRRLVTERVLKLMRARPTVTIFSVSQNDCAGYCECATCSALAEREGAQSGPILHFVNAVAEVTAQEHPTKLIDTLAYWYSLDAPRQVVPHPNVRVRVCSINCCQAHGYGTCEHPESQRFLRALQAWSKVTPQIYIWHYATNFANFLQPMPDLDELHANLNLYRREGVYGVFIQSQGEDGGGAESLALRGYVVSQLLWQPEQPLWPLVDEFLPAYYGAAAPGVRAYLEVLHGDVRADRQLHVSLYDPPTHPLFSAERVARADAPLAVAEAQVRGAERLRVRLLRHGLAYPALRQASAEFVPAGDTYGTKVPAAALAQLDTMLRTSAQAGIRYWRESVPLAITAAQIRGRLAAHRLYWLRAGEHEVAVCPAVGGRVVAWQAHGRQWLAPVDPLNHWNPYPFNGGQCEFIITGIYTYLAWDQPFRASQRGQRLTLRITVGDGLQVVRQLTLTTSGLTIVTRVTNAGPHAGRCAFGPSLHLQADATTQVTWQTASGPATRAWDALPDGLDKAEVLMGDARPGGAWQVRHHGAVLTHRFASDRIEKAIIGKVARAGSLALDLRGLSEPLPPGATLTFTQDFTCTPTARA